MVRKKKSEEEFEVVDIMEVEELPEEVSIESEEPVAEVKKMGIIHSVAASYVLINYENTLTWIPRQKGVEYIVGHNILF